MANREKATKMAAKGATAKEIRQATGVTAQAARNIVSRSSSSSGPYNATNMPMTGAAPTAGPLASGYVPLPSNPNAASNPIATGPTDPYKSINNIRQGLAIGANSTISNKEAMKIAKNTGKTFDQVLAKGVGLGFDVGAKAVNRSNKSYNRSLPMMTAPDSFYGQLLASQDPLAAMRNQKVNKGYTYQGVAVKDGPGLFGRKNVGGVNPLTIKKPDEPEKKVIKNPIGGEGYVPNQVNNDQTVQDPVTTDPVASTSDPGPGMMAGGGLGALGANKLNRAKSRLRQLGIYGRGTGLLGRGLQYGNSLNTGR
jgi:hypothetical protein